VSLIAFALKRAQKMSPVYKAVYKAGRSSNKSTGINSGLHLWNCKCFPAS